MSAPTKRSVQFMYDIISPYSWVAFEVLTRYESRWNLDIQLDPVFLGPLIVDTGNVGPAQVNSKFDYMGSDLKRLGRHHQIPFTWKTEFHDFIARKGSLPAQRYLTAVQLEQPDKVEAVSRQLWIKMWSQNKDISKSEYIIEASKEAGLSDADTDNFLAKIQEKSIKTRLIERTQAAKNDGAFGLPIIKVEVDGQKELVFGSDRFHILADMLGTEYVGPLNELSKIKIF